MNMTIKQHERDSILEEFSKHLGIGHLEIPIELVTPTRIFQMYFDDPLQAIRVIDALNVNWRHPPKDGKCGIYIPPLGWVDLHHQTIKDTWKQKGIEGEVLRYRSDSCSR